MRGEELNSEMLARFYPRGWFPMTTDDETGDFEWFATRRRCLFPITGIRVSRSLAKTLRSGRFEVRFDTDFEGVMRGCLREPGDNWITEHFIRAYGAAHAEGWAHCAEAWQENRLVGGVYGLAIGTAFFAESMFHRATDASKVALHDLVERCRELGFTVFDAQIMNPHLASLGAYEVPDRAYQRLLAEALRGSTPWSLRP